jgi:hypothetical protein|tara:strand:- start:100 stop:927 length:828 start_codon:yes stop_codon:yes gene_type:complete
MLLKREHLPPFKKLPYTFDYERINEIVRNMPEQGDDLKEKEGYGDLVGGKSAKLQKAFGLKFTSIEDAYQFLVNNDVAESELYEKDSKITKALGGRKMAWDYRSYVKPYENYIVKDKDGKYEVNGSPYKQIGLTEYNPDMENRVYDKKIPKSRLDERHYNKVKDWVKGTYIEEVLNSFKAEHTRARIAIMDPGAFIGDHIDYNTDYSVRYHIPLTTNEGCGFHVIDRQGVKHEQTMAPGECWFLNQGLKHSAWNKGKTPRAHIIISVLTQEDLNA